MTKREFAIEIVQRLRGAGFEALWAGGCVRDQLLGLEPKDYDIATSARPEQVRKLCRRTVEVGVAFGVIKVLGPRPPAEPMEVEVATFRSDSTYSDARHPDAVVFSSPREDAERRDFTINGMFFDPLEEKLIDYVGGQEDLHARRLRAIGDPAARFAEDKLRLLRAVRFAARFDLDIEAGTRAALERMASSITQPPAVSAERIRDELQKLLVHPRRGRAVNLLYEVGLAAPILRELLEMKGLPQGPPTAPTGDLWDHVIRVLDLLGPEPSFPLALAALLHDIGKRRTLGRTPERYTFYYHEHVSSRMASEVCLRLKLSNAERERVEWLVKKHQFLCDAPHMKLGKLKKMLAHRGIRELLALHRADALATDRDTAHVDYCERLLAEWSEADLNPPPLVTGHDLAELGLQPGPQFKRLLDAVRDAQLDGTTTTREQALDLVRRLITGKGDAPR